MDGPLLEPAPIDAGRILTAGLVVYGAGAVALGAGLLVLLVTLGTPGSALPASLAGSVTAFTLGIVRLHRLAPVLARIEARERRSR